MGKLVADERERAVEKCGDEYLVPGDSWRDGAIGLVDDLTMSTSSNTCLGGGTRGR